MKSALLVQLGSMEYGLSPALLNDVAREQVSLVILWGYSLLVGAMDKYGVSLGLGTDHLRLLFTGSKD